MSAALGAVPLRVGLLGYGLAGRVVHAPLLRADPGWAVTHVSTGDPDRARQAAADLPGVRVVPDAAALLACAGELDVVVVATPNALHVPLAVAALDRGLAVVVDKPLAVTAADAESVVAHARLRGRPLSVFHNRRWDSDTLTARSLLDGGVLGQVHRLESRFTRFRPQVVPRWREDAVGGGVLLDLGTHLVDQATELLGPVASVHAQIGLRRPGVVADDDDVLALTHASGAHSLLWVSAVAPWPGPRLVLQGSRAGWVVQDLDGQEAAARLGIPVPPEPPGTLWDETGPRGIASLPGDWGAFYRGFAAAVHGDGPVPVDPADGVRVLEVLEAAVRSAQQGQVVAVPAPGPSAARGQRP